METDLVIRHHIPKEKEGSYFALPFEVPSGAGCVAVSYEYPAKGRGVTNRLNGLYTSRAFYVASAAFGFVNGDDPGPNPGFAARILLCVFPFAAMVITGVITFFLRFPADEPAARTDG